MTDGDENSLSCSKCSAVWQKSGATNCWSGNPDTSPRNPAIALQLPMTTSSARPSKKCAPTATTAGWLSWRHRSRGSVTSRCRAATSRRPLDPCRRYHCLCQIDGYRKIGIATCIGLLEETDRLVAILKAQGFAPESVCCKAGSVDKIQLGLKEEDKVRPGSFEPACNPIAQARICNRIGTDMNIIVGLCIGHDMLFNKHSDAPVTTLVVKDRVTGHDPVCRALRRRTFTTRGCRSSRCSRTGSELRSDPANPSATPKSEGMWLPAGE